MTLAYKFLGEGAVGLLSGFAWPVGDWVEVTGPLLPSERGVHACLTAHLPYWVDEELWRIELDGEVLETERMLVAARGRLVERVASWNAQVMREFAQACVERVRGIPGYEQDAVFWASQQEGAGAVSYLAAHVAGLAAADWTQGFAAERGWQADWLAERLGLAALPDPDPHRSRPLAAISVSPPPAGEGTGGREDHDHSGFVWLTTKLYPPASHAPLVPRPGLVERLCEPFTGKLTLLAAPPGWGKTTLLDKWRTSPYERRPFAWLSLDPADNDPVRFWSYVVQAARNVAPGICSSALALLRTPRVSVTTDLLPTLINELAAVGEPIVLALDDYHVIINPDIHEAITFLLDHLPPTLHIALASRAEPELPVARMRVRGQLREVRADELRFSRPETEALLNEALGLRLTPEQVTVLQERTEGWAAGLHLAALSLRGRTEPDSFIATFAGDDRYLADYLLSEVLDRQPESVRHFLLHTAILDRLCGPLCDAVTGTTGSTQTLERLERANLFLSPLDQRREWYRYHHLFAQLLRHEVEHREPDLVAALHRRAAAWYRNAGHVTEAIAHATAAGDAAEAAALIAAHWSAFAQRGMHETVDGWLDALPAEVISSDPQLCLTSAWTCLSHGRVDQARGWIQAAERGRLPDSPLDRTASIESSVAVARAVCHYMVGEFAAASDFAAQALALEDQPYWRGVASSVLGQALHWRGKTTDAVVTLEDAVRIARTGGDALTEISALGHLAAIHAERGELSSAAELADQAVSLGENTGAAEHWAGGLPLIVCGQVLERRGSLDEAAAAIERGLRLARRGVLMDVAYGLVALACVQHAHGDRVGASDLLREARRLAQSCPEPGILAGMLAEAEHRLRLAPGRQARAALWGEELTDRELAVLRLLPTQLSQTQIAAAQYVSRNTVKTQTRSIYRKLDATSRAQAVHRARELGLL